MKPWMVVLVLLAVAAATGLLSVGVTTAWSLALIWSMAWAIGLSALGLAVLLGVGWYGFNRFLVRARVDAMALDLRERQHKMLMALPDEEFAEHVTKRGVPAPWNGRQ